MEWFKANATLVAILAATCLGAATGGYVAWRIQGANLTALELSVEKRDNKVLQKALDDKDEADKKRVAAETDFRKAKGELDVQIKSNEAFKRCVAAGKCGVQPASCSTSIRLPTTGNADGRGTDAVPAGTRRSEVADDCSVTTLMLNKLQADIENQEGYR